MLRTRQVRQSNMIRQATIPLMLVISVVIIVLQYGYIISVSGLSTTTTTTTTVPVKRKPSMSSSAPRPSPLSSSPQSGDDLYQSVSFREIPILDDDDKEENDMDEDAINVLMDGQTVGERIKFGESIVEVCNLLSKKECDWLVNECIKFSKTIQPTRILDKPGLVRIPTIEAYHRAQKTNTPCSQPIPTNIDIVLGDILQRVLRYIDNNNDLSSISTTLFHTNREEENQSSSLLESLYQNDQLKYSSREPAINIYTKDGQFLPHKDSQSLTILIPLSTPNSQFTGGGTAFWQQDSRGHRVEEPTIISKPNVGGTVIMFGGCVTHSGVTVTNGTRVVFVASFSLKQQQQHIQRDGSNQSVNEDNINSPQRDIYGDSM